MSNPTELPDLGRLRQIGNLIATQDNRYTDQPMFIVQQRRRVYGFDADDCENVIWLCSEDDYSEARAEEAAELESEYQESGRVKSGWQRTGYIDQWEFVTACFTEQGCKEYLQRDGHNLKEPRIYAEGSYRNEEFRAVRSSLIALARRPPVPAQRPTDDELWDSTIRDRDTYQEWADKLAGAIAIHFGVDIGEHSNANCPWHEALEAIENAEPARRAQPEFEAPRIVFEANPGGPGHNWVKQAFEQPEGEAPQADAMAAFKKWHQEFGDQDCVYTWLQAWTAAQLSRSASAPGTPEAPQTAAARDVLAERLRQVEVEGWTPARDDEYVDGQLASAAVAYAQAYTPYLVPSSWPWAVEWFKPADDRRNLVKAGALIVAEIERLDRAAQLDGGQGESHA